jgi:hypothetical protein
MRELLENKEKPSDISELDYMLMFDSPHGHRVLAHLLYDMHFIEEVETPDEVSRRNTLTRLLHRAGIFKESNLKLLAQKLLEVGRISKEEYNGSLQPRRDNSI